MVTDQITGINSELHDTNQKLICEQYKDGIENSQQLDDLTKEGKVIVIGAGPNGNELAKAVAATKTVAIVGKSDRVEQLNLTKDREVHDIEVKVDPTEKLKSPVTKPIVIYDDTIYDDTTKVHRNDPCRCGSGKKYKNCCYNQHHDGKRYHYYNNN